MTYAQMMDIPFVYSSNGDGFYEHDFLTGQEREIPLHQFPTYDELCARFTTEANDGAGISPAEAAVINQPYYTSTTTYAPRYYQRITINRCVEEIARGQNRLLLVMATGAPHIISTGRKVAQNKAFWVSLFFRPVAGSG